MCIHKFMDIKKLVYCSGFWCEGLGFKAYVWFYILIQPPHQFRSGILQIPRLMIYKLLLYKLS